MWNWVGFNASSLMSVTDALAGMEPQNGDIIKAQRGIAYYDNYEWLGSLQTLMPGKGYKIFSASANDRTFSYPAKTAAGANARMAQPLTTQPSSLTPQFTPVDYRNYPANMVLIAQVVGHASQRGEGVGTQGSVPYYEPLVGVELGVFAGEECREARHTLRSSSTSAAPLASGILQHRNRANRSLTCRVARLISPMRPSHVGSNVGGGLETD